MESADIQIYERLARLETKIDVCLGHLQTQNGRVSKLEDVNDKKESELWTLKERSDTQQKYLRIIIYIMLASGLIQIPEATKVVGSVLGN